MPTFVYIKSMILLYFDTETTGLDIKNCSIWQLSGYIKDTATGRSDSFDFKLHPYKGETITAEAEKKTGVSQAELDTFPSQALAFNSFTELLSRYVNLEDWNQRVIPVGYNVSFDLDFLRDWFTFNGMGQLFSKNIYFPGIDVMYLASFALLGKRSKMRNFQLTTVYETVLGKTFPNAHNALADIDATKELLDAIILEMRK